MGMMASLMPIILEAIATGMTRTCYCDRKAAMVACMSLEAEGSTRDMRLACGHAHRQSEALRVKNGAVLPKEAYNGKPIQKRREMCVSFDILIANYATTSTRTWKCLSHQDASSRCTVCALNTVS